MEDDDVADKDYVEENDDSDISDDEEMLAKVGYISF
jgi:hypothetical protein